MSLALGTGANATICGAAYALLFRLPAGVDGAGLLNIYTSQFSGAPFGGSSAPDYRTLAAEATTLETVAAAEDHAVRNVRLGSAEARARVVAVTQNFFSTLRMRPHLGRLLADGDERAGPQPIVISHALWTTLGAPEDVVGKSLIVGDAGHPIVGIAPERFRGLQSSRIADVWIPMSPGGSARGDRGLSLIGRLKPGISLDDAGRDLDAVAARLAAQYPKTNRGSLGDPDAPRMFSAAPYSQLDPGTRHQVGLIAAIVVGAVTLLLTSACANAASLLISRGVARRRELAVKVALGASRGMLVRQLLIEGILISLAGAALGLLFAVWTTDAMPALFAPEHAALLDTRLDLRLVVLTAAVACAAGALASFVPARGVTTAPAATLLRGDMGGISDQQGGTRLRSILVASQVALSTLLLIATGALVGGLSQALTGDFGATARNVAVFAVENPGREFRPELGVAYQATVAETLKRMAGIESVGWATVPPLGAGNMRQFRLEGDGPETVDSVDFNVNLVSASYFGTMGLSRIEGRNFDERDRPRTAPVVIVDEILARRYFGAVAAGRCLLDAAGTRLEIVGVVRSGKYRTLQAPPPPTVYFPVTQEYIPVGFIFVRTAREPQPMLDHLTTILKGIDSRAEVNRAFTLESHLSHALVMDRLTTVLVGLCGVIALIMSTIGVYGVMSDAVQRRTREIGLRVALGAGTPHVARLVFGEAAAAATAGGLMGIGAALLLSRAAQSVVHGLPGPDVATLATAPGMLAAAVAIAAVLPLRRALGVSPTIALRAQ
jgi:predicted permease